MIKRDEATLEKLRKELTGVITYHQVVQYLFFSQWAELKSYANKNGIQIIGDMPITFQLIVWKSGLNHTFSN